MAKTKYQIDDLESVQPERREEYIQEHIRRNIEGEVMKEIGYGTLLYYSYDYEVYKASERDRPVQTVSIDMEYTRLSEMRVGETWGFRIKRGNENSKFLFEVKKESKDRFVSYTVEGIGRTDRAPNPNLI